MKGNVIFLCLLNIFCLYSAAGDITIFKDPKPTCEEKVYVQLQKTGELVDTLDSNYFLVSPWSLTADCSGNIYVFDSMMGKIYKYGKDLKLLRTFGGKGTGPGEFATSVGRGGGYIYLYLQENFLYAGDRMNKKIICFDTSGKMVKEHKMKVKPFAIHSTGARRQKKFLYSL